MFRGWDLRVDSPGSGVVFKGAQGSDAEPPAPASAGLRIRVQSSNFSKVFRF